MIEQFAEDGVTKRDDKMLSEAVSVVEVVTSRDFGTPRHKFIRGTAFCGQSLVKPMWNC